MFEIKDCVGFTTNRGAKAICEAMDKKFREHRVTRVQWTALYYIRETPNITQKQLAAKMMTQGPSIVHLIDRLEQEGLVLRSQDKLNRRVKIISLTKPGEDVFHALLPVAEQFNKDAILGISDDDMLIFKKVLYQMIENVN